MSLSPDPLIAAPAIPKPRRVPDTERVACGIIFDLDDTLALTAPHWKRAETALLNLLNHEWSEELSLKYKGMNTFDVAATIHQELKPDVSLEFCQRVLRHSLFESLGSGAIMPMPGAFECVHRARSLAPLAIASGSPLSVIELVLKQLGIADAFDVKISSESVAKGKPAPDVFLAAARELRVEPDSCLVFEDSLVGAQAARNAGMACLAVPSSRPDEVRQMTSRCYSSLDEISLEEMSSYLPQPSAFQTPGSRFRATSGFSLLELSICIAIMAVLTALGLAATGAVRAPGKQAVCATNIRTLAMGVIAYAADHNGAFPQPFGEGEAKSWDGLIMPYLGHTDLTKPNPHLQCPADPRPVEVAPKKFRRSYKISSQPAQAPDSPMGVIGYYNDPAGGKDYLTVVRRQAHLTHPADTILLFEQFTTNELKGQYLDYYQFASGNSMGSGWRNGARIVGHLPDGSFYHGDRILFAMADGHVEAQLPSWAYTPHVRWDAVR